MFNNIIIKDDLDKLNDLFFNNKVVNFEEKFTGQRFENNKIILGCNAGPTYHVEFLCHEMAHFVELEEERLLKRPIRNWDFKYGTYYEIGLATGFEARTCQAIEREIRCWSLQYSLMKHLNISFCKSPHDNFTDLYDLVRSVVYLDGFIIYKYNKFPNEELDYKTKEELAIKEIEREVLNLTSIYNFDYFIENWNKRINLLER